MGMCSLNVAVLGSGSVRCAVPVFASLATYFGERPLNLRLWDADPERADLFERFANLCFTVARSAHRFETFATPEAAAAGADRLVVQIDSNAARLMLKRARGQSRDDDLAAAVEELLVHLPEETPLLDLCGEVSPLRSNLRRIEGWPPGLDEPTERALPHQVLRWIRGEEYVLDLLARHEQNPIKLWLDELEIAARKI